MLECSVCNLKYHKLNRQLCDFCDIVYNLKKIDMYKFVICRSELDQIDIIKKTYEHFMKTDTIPVPSDIDEKSIIISVNPYIFKTYVVDVNYKIFFTNCMNRNNIKAKRFTNTYPIEKLNTDKFVGENLKNIDENTYNKYINILHI